MNVLDQIVQNKKQEVAAQKAAFPIDQLIQMEYFHTPVRSTIGRLSCAKPYGIIAEFKRKSPSKGIINDQLEVSEVVQGYEQAGATALSILTDSPYFGGSVDDLKQAKRHTACPLLRKDFIIDEYQVYHTKAIGADLMLLIAAILTKQQVLHFTQLAHDLGLEVLLEIHNEQEFHKAYQEEVDILGVNNRDLKRFKTSLQTSLDLANLLPTEQLKISESGISSAEDMCRLSAVGYHGFLIGERLMRHSHPGEELRRLSL